MAQQHATQSKLRPSATAATTTGAESVLQAAAAYGVRVCFANPGTTEMHFLPALDSVAAGSRQHAMHSVLCLHETVATGAADGYARVARRPAMALLHLGVGLANGLANLHNARRAGSQVLVVVGDMAEVRKHDDSHDSQAGRFWSFFV